MVAIRLQRIPALFSEGIEEAPASLSERRRRKDESLRETLRNRLRRLTTAAAFFVRHGRLVDMACAVDLLLRDALVGVSDLPDPRTALEHPNGLCGIARAPTPAEALEAYSSGLVLYAPVGPVAWWSPSCRWTAQPGSLGCADAAVSQLLDLGAGAEMDHDIEETLLVCSRADPIARRPGFCAKLARIYSDLAERGLVHSICIRDASGQRLAGAFGLAIGKVFMTEGVFGPDHLVRSALVLLDRQLALRDFVMHEARLGATPGAAPGGAFATLQFQPMPRAAFIAIANRHLFGLRTQRWRLLPAARSDKRVETGFTQRRPAFASAA